MLNQRKLGEQGESTSARAFAEVDVVLAPSFTGDTLLAISGRSSD
jgi:hypothetical protein